MVSTINFISAALTFFLLGAIELGPLVWMLVLLGTHQPQEFLLCYFRFGQLMVTIITLEWLDTRHLQLFRIQIEACRESGFLNASGLD
jgi:hypothetical protein